MSYISYTTIEKLHKLAVTGIVTHSNGTAERCVQIAGSSSKP